MAWSTGFQVGGQCEIKWKSQQRASGEPSGPLRDYSDTVGQEHGALAWGSDSENRKKTEGH